MDPITQAILASIAAGGIDAAFGGSETMTPEQRRALEYVWSELRKSDVGLGFSPQEKMGLQKKLKTGIREYSEEQTGIGTKSLGRRGVSGPGQIAAMTTDIMAGAGETYGEGLTEIDLASARAGRQRRGQLTGMLPGLSQGYLDQGPDIGSSMADFISNLAYYQASKKKKPDEGSSIGDITAPSMFVPSPPRRQRRSVWESQDEGFSNMSGGDSLGQDTPRIGMDWGKYGRRRAQELSDWYYNSSTGRWERKGN